MDNKNIKKWVLLAGVATALLIVPRRSSQKSDIKPVNKPAAEADGKSESRVNKMNRK